MKEENIMRKIRIEKVLLSCGATGEDLDKAVKLLKLISQSKPQIIASKKRIPNFGVRPGLNVGTRVTIRGKNSIELLKRLLSPKVNELKESQISQNHFSFGIKEYIEIPGIEYHREIGIRGLNVTVVFTRHGVRVKRKKIKRSKIPKKQYISKDEIKNYMQQNFNITFRK